MLFKVIIRYTINIMNHIENEDPAEVKIKGFYNRPHFKIIDIYNGEKAWKYIVEFKYNDSNLRRHLRNRWKNYDRSAAYLVIYLDSEDSQDPLIGADYYLNKYHINANPDVENEGDMFNTMNYSFINHEASPKFIRKLLINYSPLNA